MDARHLVERSVGGLMLLVVGLTGLVPFTMGFGTVQLLGGPVAWWVPLVAVGVIGTNHLVFVVVDGRSEGYSEGVTMTELAEIMQGLGATTAYNLDGGGSSTMYFNGSLVNNPLGANKERGTSDILYIAG